jgi:hypothetical protein
MKSALFPLSVRRVVGRLSGLLSVLLLVCVLAPAASGCTGAQKSGILTVRDDARGRTKRLDPRNQLSGTTKTNPAWANPGTYFYDDNSTVFFVELKVQSNNVPMKLNGASFIIGGNRVFLDRCAPTVETFTEEGTTKTFTETSECRLEKDIFQQIGDAPEVRVIFEGSKERSAMFSTTNRQRFQKFFALVTKPEQ